MEEIIRFLTEYTEMLEKMEQKQVEKLGLLMTKELDKIEESIMMQQAMDKQLQNMEQRRQELFERMGLTGKTLQEVAESCGGEERKQLTDLYRRLDGAIGNIRFYNERRKAWQSRNWRRWDWTRGWWEIQPASTGRRWDPKASGLRKRSDGGPV